VRHFVEMFRRWNDFSGRSSRSEYWWPLLIICISYVCCETPFLIAKNTEVSPGFLIFSTILSAIYALFALISFIPHIALQIRRLHDCNRSGWFCLLPIVNLIMYRGKGDQAENRFGQPSMFKEYYISTRDSPQAFRSPVSMHEPSRPAHSGPQNGHGLTSHDTEDAYSALEKLAALHEKGVLTPEEFAVQKKRILSPT
jgi:uncharacterized membrane protein YhaH (DUF805 family)